MNLSINTYRFFAFFAVFLFHIGVFDGGYLGVQAFFVLSGYLLTPILLETKKNTKNLTTFLKNFLTRRFLRIFPLYYLYLLILLLTIVIFGLKEYSYFLSLKQQLIYGFTYTYNLYHKTSFFEHNMFITHFWSLAVEEQFYLVWPFIIYYISIKNLKNFLILIVILGPFFRLIIGQTAGLEIYSFKIIEDIDLAVYLSTLSHFDAFAIGGIFGISPNFKINKNNVLIFIISIIIIGLMFNYYNSGILNLRSIGYPSFMRGSYKYVWGYSLLNLCFCLLLVALRDRKFMSGIFENKILASLGLISYGLYVYHFGIIWIVRNVFDDSNKLVHILISFTLTILVSYISFYLFEKYFMNLKDKLAPKKKLNTIKIKKHQL